MPLRLAATCSRRYTPRRMNLSLLLVTAQAAVVLPARAQSHWGAGLNAGLAFPPDTLSLETTLRVFYRPHVNGVFVEFVGGSDWGLQHRVVYDLYDLNLGYAAPLGAKTSVLFRIGGGAWVRKDATGRSGSNAGVSLRYLMSATRGWRVDFTWHRFPGFAVHSICASFEAY